jgi:hypothetical protein
VVRPAIGSGAEAVAVDAYAGPLPEPGPHLGARPAAGQGLPLEVEGEEADADRPAGKFAVPVPALAGCAGAVGVKGDRLAAVETRLDAIGSLRQDVRAQLAGIRRELVGVEADGEGVFLAERRQQAAEPEGAATRPRPGAIFP